MATTKNTFVLIAPAVMMLSLPVLTGCSSAADKAAEKETSAVVPAIETTLVQKGRLASTLDLPGELISFQQVDLFAREASFVKDIFVDVGSEVSKEQVLAALEAPEIASRLAAAESRLKASEAVYLATKASHDRLVATSETPGTVSPNDLDQARAKLGADLAQLEAAKASVREVRSMLAYLTIRAPFDGIITARKVNPGAYVGSPGKAEPLFVLQEQKRLRLVVSIPEAYSEYLRPGDAVGFNIKALPERVFHARVARMAGALDVRLRSQRVELDVVNEDGKLLPGMVANVVIPMVPSDSSLVVPNSAIVNSQENVFVIRVERDTARWVNVSTGRRAGDMTEIFGPLHAGDRLIKKATDEVRNGQLIHGD
jgi:RND family efflux transporter MFP subunit